MATWTNFYIQTSAVENVADKIISLSDEMVLTRGDFPGDMHDHYLYNEDLAPTYLAISSTQPGWVTIVHNSFDKMADWGEELSKFFNTRLIVLIAQTTSSVYYFALYDRGEKLREIETCYSEDFKMVNFGNKFDFENEQPGKKVNYGDGDKYMFTFGSIEDYCTHFGLTIQADYSEVTWTILKSPQIADAGAAAVKKMEKKKPKWKFW